MSKIPGPSDFEALLEWWHAGIVSRGEFVGYLLPLLNEDNIDDVMGNIPTPLVSKVSEGARSLCRAYHAGERFVHIGNGPVPDDVAMEALCKWVSRQ